MIPEAEIIVTGRPFELYLTLLDLDRSELLHYDSVLDTGSGFSDFTGRLLEMEKEAVAVDKGYSCLDSMKESYLEGEILGDEHQLRRQYLHIVKECSTRPEMVQKIMLYREAIFDRFQSVFSNHPEAYLGEDCFQLPFRDNSFDLAANVELIANSTYFSTTHFLEGIKELSRVARAVRIYSIFFNQAIYEQDEFVNHDDFSFNRLTDRLLVIERK
tara:strand:+ start:171 stop:815 length:645 start_codon:yes stop_codon:yes gene_type:complete